MSKLTGKTALVTGASRGIGKAIAERLAADRALVAVHYGRNEAAAKSTVAAIEQAGGRAFIVGADLGVARDFDTLFAGLKAGLAGSPLDILVNNAGGALGTGSIEKTTPGEFDRLIALNMRTPFFIIQRALPLFRDGGRIINISSADARIAITGELAYSMAKGAINVLSRTLAHAVGGRGITVNPKLRVVWMPRPRLACAFALGLAAVSDYVRRVSEMAAPMSSKAWRCSLVGSARTGTVAGVPAKRSSLRVRVPRWASSLRKLR